MPPTLICVPLRVRDVESSIADAQLARDHGADLVEWRIDELFTTLALDDVAQATTRLVQESPLPSIVTCRSAREGGAFDGSPQDLALLLGALDPDRRGIPAHVDLELAMIEGGSQLRDAIRAQSGEGGAPPQRVILSHHDLDGRPARLFELLGRMRDVDVASVLKLVWQGRSVRDNLEAFDLLTERDRPMIVLVMGEAGLMSRVLSAKFGGFLTFASLEDGASTAPGQPTLAELTKLYRFRSIGRRTRVFGVLGWPVAHSISPQVHNVGFEAVGFDGVYLPLPVAPGWEPFKASVLAMLDHPSLDLRGLSVTIPHKEHLVRLAREDASRRWEIEPMADRLGAANTLIVEDNGLCRAINTDAPGIIEPLRAHLGASAPRGLRAVVLGAGGAARAAVVALAEGGAEVIVAARRDEASRALVDELREACGSVLEESGGAIRAVSLAQISSEACQVLVNCTPVGMARGPDPAGSPIDLEQLLRERDSAEGLVVFDTVYTPIRTPFIRQAELMKLVTIVGLEMFVEQASHQFELWTGHRAPRDLFQRVARETLQDTSA